MTYEPSKSNSFFVDKDHEEDEEKREANDRWLENFKEEKEFERMVATGKTCFTCKRWRTPHFSEGYANLIKKCPDASHGCIVKEERTARKDTCFNWTR